MFSERWFLTIISLVLLTLLFFPVASWKTQQFLRFGFRGQPATPLRLEMENLALRTELAKLRSLEDQLPEETHGFVAAHVFSRYPLNFKNELMLDVGEDSGIALGAMVVLQPADGPGSPILVGRVSRLWPDRAAVQTIFDANYKIAARIGRAATDSLLIGGSQPRLTVIPKSAKLEEDQPVYAASQEASYGVALGSVGRATVVPETSLQEAELKVPYDLNELNIVLVQTKR